jgi:hypothetical protein
VTVLFDQWPVAVAKNADCRLLPIQPPFGIFTRLSSFVQHMTDGNFDSTSPNDNLSRISAFLIVVDIAGDSNDRRDFL